MSTLTVGNRVQVQKGCKTLDITKGMTATVTEIKPLGADYSHQVKVILSYGNRMVALYATHMNRLSDPVIPLLGNVSGNRILVQVKS